MKTKEKTLSRAEVKRRIQSLTIDPWKNLSGRIDGCYVNAWAVDNNRRISRISVSALPGMGGTASKAMKLAKKLAQSTGLTIHWHGGMTASTICSDGRTFPGFYFTTPKLP